MKFIRIIFIFAMLLLPASLCAEGGQPSEYQVKAAFLLNFGKFVVWPPTSFPSNSAPLVLGVYGGNSFVADLENIVRGQNIAGHPVTVRLLTNPRDLRKCHIVFISMSQQRQLVDVLDALQGASVLTVTEDMNHFRESGLMINFVIDREGRIRFEINNGAAERAGLRISSKLLNLARRPPHGPAD